MRKRGGSPEGKEEAEEAKEFEFGKKNIAMSEFDAASGGEGVGAEPVSAEERLQYLKDRGVEVETVEDREKARQGGNATAPVLLQAAASIGSESEGEALGAAASEGAVEFALIPHDTAKPIRRMYLPASSRAPGDALPTFVKPYFADGLAVDAGLLGEQVRSAA